MAALSHYESCAHAHACACVCASICAHLICAVSECHDVCECAKSASDQFLSFPSIPDLLLRSWGRWGTWESRGQLKGQGEEPHEEGNEDSKGIGVVEGKWGCISVSMVSQPVRVAGATNIGTRDSAPMIISRCHSDSGTSRQSSLDLPHSSVTVMLTMGSMTTASSFRGTWLLSHTCRSISALCREISTTFPLLPVITGPLTHRT